MKHRFFLPCLVLLLLTLVLAILPSPARAGEIGDPAAPLQILKWVKGNPVDLAAGKGKNIYVIEFWATWCGPCKASIPHLTKIQQQFKDKGVIIVGISDEAPEDVEPFVTEMGSKMDYTVAVDKEGKTGEGYMQAFGIDGIPHAFVVGKEGHILWEGHPMDKLDLVLAQVVEGKFDVATAKKESAERKSRENVQALIQAYNFLVRKSGEKDIIKLIRDRIVEKAKDQPENLNEFAWGIAMNEAADPAELQIALQSAERANTLSNGKSATILDTYAVALHRNGRTPEAIKSLEKALELADDDKTRENIENHLEEYKAALAK